MVKFKKGPSKKIFTKGQQRLVLKEVKKYVCANLPKTKIYMKRIFGSLATGKFGKYERKFKRRYYSDVDILFVVSDNFKSSKKWKLEFKPNDILGKVYRRDVVNVEIGKSIITIDMDYAILPITYTKKPGVMEFYESIGFPLRRKSKNKFIRV
jgi:hypothetical protein